MNKTPLHRSNLVQKDIVAKPVCKHCGELCLDRLIHQGVDYFCCNGCLTVFNLLNEKDLGAYYACSVPEGIKPEGTGFTSSFEWLDAPGITDQIVDFNDGQTAVVSFEIPAIHCASCIWLLENLSKLDEGVKSTRVDFSAKTVTITYNPEATCLRNLAELLAGIGYAPEISPKDGREHKPQNKLRRLYLQLGVAGFAFGNIMLLSFPGYLRAGSDHVGSGLTLMFGLLSLALVFPVMLFSAQSYFVSAWQVLRRRMLNIDVPIAIGIIALFFRSVYEVAFLNEAGYFDSLSGLVFLLLLGKMFQEKTYSRLSFERTYRSFFPLTVKKIHNSSELSITINDLHPGDRIVIRHGEVIPTDGVIMAGTGSIDYSFVTGESDPANKEPGEPVYAGGRQTGGALEIEVIKEASQSYLTRLWEHDALKHKNEDNLHNLTDRISRYFVSAVLLIAIAAFIFWLRLDASIAFNVLTAVLIVACPCALALSAPFTLGTALRILGYNRLYLKNADVIEQIAQLDQIIFDKTGTLAIGKSVKFESSDRSLTAIESGLIRSVVRQSNHPLSRAIDDFLVDADILEIDSFEEIPGEGIVAIHDQIEIKVGSAAFVRGTQSEDLSDRENATVFVAIENAYRGLFIIESNILPSLKSILSQISMRLKVALLSGDRNNMHGEWSRIFPENSELLFEQSPHDKLEYIRKLQGVEKKRVMMVGDGLNDAGGLAAADVGLAVSGDATMFAPASDALIRRDDLGSLPEFMQFSRQSLSIIKVSFMLSFLYNVVGLGFAVTGNLSPLVSAILMPLSSISVVTFAVLATGVAARRNGLRVSPEDIL
ncbi:heavy metal translocating P-type ATPase metal-binding domain-containing protein [Calditrichota bacterium]